jgi:hypothetical protein
MLNHIEECHIRDSSNGRHVRTWEDPQTGISERITWDLYARLVERVKGHKEQEEMGKMLGQNRQIDLDGMVGVDCWGCRFDR